MCLRALSKEFLHLFCQTTKYLILSGQTKVLTLVCVSSRHDVDSGDGEPDRCGAARTTDRSVV